MEKVAEQPNSVIYTSSVKIEQTAKGAATVSVHIYGTQDDDARTRAVALYKSTIESLKEAGLPVAAEVAK